MTGLSCVLAAIALVGLSVAPMGSAARTTSEPSSTLAKQMRSLAATTAAKRSRRVLNDAILSPLVGRALRASLKKNAGEMTPFEKSLVSAGALIGDARYESLLGALRSGHKLTAKQTKSLGRLLSAFAANPAVRVLIKRGRALQASPKELADLLATLRAEPMSVASKFPTTGLRDLNTVFARITHAVRLKATASVSHRLSALLAMPGAAKYLKALPPLDVAVLVPAYELGTYTLPSTARVAAAGSQAATPGSAWGAAVLQAQVQAAGDIINNVVQDVAVGKLGSPLLKAAKKATDLLDDEAVPMNAVETLEQGTVPPLLQLVPAQPGPWVAGVPYGFVVVGYWSNGKLMGPVTFGTVLGPTLEMTSGDGGCPGATCTAKEAGPHTVTAFVGGSSRSVTLNVVPAALKAISIQEILPPFSDPLAANVIGVPEGYNVYGTDVFGNTVTGLTFDLSISPAGGSPSSCAGLSCTPTVAGANTVTAVTQGAPNGPVGSVTIYVVGVPDHLELTPKSTTWTVDTPNSVGVASLDSAGDHLATLDPSDVLMSVTGPNGASATCPRDVCIPSEFGLSTVKASYTVPATGNTITGSVVVNVSPVSLSLSPNPASVPAGQAQQFTVKGLDGVGDDLGPDPDATLAISPDGSCTGDTCTPASPGDHTVTATDGSATGQADLMVESELEVTTRTLGATWLGTPYSQTLRATGGTPPYTWQIITGGLFGGDSLRSWLTLNPSTGVISGTEPESDSCVNCDTTDGLVVQVTDADGQTASFGAISLLVAGTPAPCAGGCSLRAAPSGSDLIVTFPSYVPTNCWVPDTDPDSQYPDGYPAYYYDDCYLAAFVLNSAGNNDTDEYGFADGRGSTMVADGQDPSTIEVPFSPLSPALDYCSPNCAGDKEWLELWYAPTDSDQSEWSLISISNAVTL
jgi:hypothetical protein